MCNIGQQHCAALQSLPGRSGSVSLQSALVTASFRQCQFSLSLWSHLLFTGNSMCTCIKTGHRQYNRRSCTEIRCLLKSNQACFSNSLSCDNLSKHTGHVICSHAYCRCTATISVESHQDCAFSKHVIPSPFPVSTVHLPLILQMSHCVFLIAPRLPCGSARQTCQLVISPQSISLSA